LKTSQIHDARLRNVRLEIEMPFAQATTTLERILAFKPSVHSLERSQRAASQEVLDTLFREPGQSPEAAAPRPKPCFKSVRACLQRDEDETTAPQIRTIFSWMACEVAQRNPELQGLDLGVVRSTLPIRNCRSSCRRDQDRREREG
jgi:hypothetical protein